MINVEKIHFSFLRNSSALHKNRFLAEASLKLARLAQTPGEPLVQTQARALSWKLNSKNLSIFLKNEKS